MAEPKHYDYIAIGGGSGMYTVPYHSLTHLIFIHSSASLIPFAHLHFTPLFSHHSPLSLSSSFTHHSLRQHLTIHHSHSPLPPPLSHLIAIHPSH